MHSSAFTLRSLLLLLASAAIAACGLAASTRARAAAPPPIAHTAAVRVRKVPGATTDLEGVACVSPSRCYGVGSVKRTGAWVVIHDGVPGRAKEVAHVNALESVACGSSVSCEAVGQNASQLAVVVGSVNGIPTAAQTLGSRTFVLGSVSCPDATVCESVGADQGVVVQTSGGAPPSAFGAPGVGLFSSISCGSPTVCEATGSALNTGDGLLKSVINGVPATSSRREPGRMLLESIHCQSASTCVAVGGFEPPHRHEGVTVTINNGVLGKPHVLSNLAILVAVACTTSTTCVALGNTRFGPNHPAKDVMVKLTNGAPAKPKVLPGVFKALACPTAETCFAVGDALRRPNDGLVASLPVGH